MAQTVETIKEARWRNGKQFLFLMNINDLAVGADADVVICIGDKPVIIETINLEADAESLTWQAFGGTQITDGTGTAINPIPRNGLAATKPNASVLGGPAITFDGQAFTNQPLNLIAQIFRNNNYYLDQDLISTDFSFAANTCYLIRLTNTSADPANIQFTISTSNE